MSHRPSTARCQRPYPFTLIELLVVVAIISVLASMLLPALTKSRDRATTIACGSTARQLGLVMGQYLGDSAGRLPYAAHWDHRDSPLSDHFSWSDQYGTHSGIIWADSLWDYASTPVAWTCPKQEYRTIGARIVPGYTYNVYLGFGPYSDWWTPSRFTNGLLHEEAVKSPERKVLFGCSAEGARPGGTLTRGHPTGDFSWDMPRFGVPGGQWNSYPGPGGVVHMEKHQHSCPVVMVGGNLEMMTYYDNFGTPLTGDSSLVSVRTTKWLDPFSK